MNIQASDASSREFLDVPFFSLEMPVPSQGHYGFPIFD
jgi:hypothetical protein